MSSWRSAWQRLRAESLRSVWERAADRRADLRRERAFESLSAEPLQDRSEVLNVLPFPLRRQWGGTALQALARFDEEAPLRPLAVAMPAVSGEWRVESRSGVERRVTRLDAAWPPDPLALADPAFEAAMLRAAELSGSSILHFESAAGLPLRSLLRLADRGSRWVLSVQDFALFCPRPNLVELGPASFCGFCRDPPRCSACLSPLGDISPRFQEERRELAAAVMARAGELVFPSAYLRAEHERLFPGAFERAHVIPPALPGLSVASPRPGPIRHVAFIGALQRHKGAHLVPEIASRLSGSNVHFSVFGGGDAELTRPIREHRALRWHGWYRAGSLPRLLRREEVDLALLLSIVPESHSLTLDECLAGGVPALAFDHGALGERIGAMRCGKLIPLAGGALAVSEAILALASGRETLDLEPRLWRVGTPAHAARAHLELYNRFRSRPPGS
jgi:glycosyltransferase involved in cell wall biosynthesis